MSLISSDACFRRPGRRRLRPAAGVVATLLLAATAHAQPQDSRFEELWSHVRLYTGGADAFFDSVQLSGRLQVDQAYVDDGSNEHSETNLRRLRLGVRVRFLDNFLLHAEADYDPQDGGPVYRKLTDTYVAWRPSEAFGLTLGKHSAAFTLDGMTSSKELLAIDRSNLTNNIWFTQEYIPGVSVAGRRERLSYQLGLYSSGTGNRGFGNSDGGEFWLGTLGYDFADRLGSDTARLAVNLVDNEPDPRNDFTRPLERIVSVNFKLEQPRWGLGADLSAADGYLGQSDLSGFTIMPHYNLRDSNAQLVARYTNLRSDDENGVRFARFESERVAGRGDRYREIYLGMNYYWYGHKLKLQTGLQYADMDDSAGDGGAYSGLTWTTGFRVSW